MDGLKGNLLLIHSTGDDNVHYQNCEMLINELVKHGKMFSLMSYPMRTHAINEGSEPLSTFARQWRNIGSTTFLQEGNKNPDTGDQTINIISVII